METIFTDITVHISILSHLISYRIRINSSNKIAIEWTSDGCRAWYPKTWWDHVETDISPCVNVRVIDRRFECDPGRLERKLRRMIDSNAERAEIIRRRSLYNQNSMLKLLLFRLLKMNA